MTAAKREIKTNNDDKQSFLSPLPNIDANVFRKVVAATLLFFVALIFAVAVPISQTGITHMGDFSFDFIVAGMLIAFSGGLLHGVMDSTRVK